jgi:hypothetical protein
MALTTLLIIGISLALFVYWFRYTAVLILRTRSADDAEKVASANHLRFVQVRRTLHTPEAGSLGALRDLLQQDYRVLKYLLGHAANLQSGYYTAEQRLLMANFRCMAWWFAVMAPFRPNAAKMALLEMSTILEYFAGVIGRRQLTPARAAVRS